MLVKGKVAQSFLTLCDPMDYTVHRILQARILEWVDYPFSSRSSQPRISCIAGGFFLPAELLGKPLVLVLFPKTGNKKIGGTC